jgi:YfiH family protein
VKLIAPFERAGEHLAIDLPGGVRALFTTRRGGVSSGPYATLNLGRLTDDRRDHVEQNRASLADRLGVAFAYGRQVHGAHVRRVSSVPSENGALEEADGQATALYGVAPMVLVADCLPIALAGRGAVAMLHAGWRGLAAGVIEEGVRALGELGAEPLAAAIGPGAGPCCYEVGDEVRAAFVGHGPAVFHGRNLDLKAIVRRELLRAGVAVVHDAELCTICAEPSLFYSHRRDRGVTGRQAGVAWLT